MKKLLLHTCCAPCSTAVIEKLSRSTDFLITAFFFNPNIHPITEYERRKTELKTYLDKMDIPYLDRDEEILWRDQAKSWFAEVKGVEWASEKSRQRCEPCIRLRFETTAQQAKYRGFDVFATTLSISPYKDAEQINRLGLAVAKDTDIPFLEADFKQDGGYSRSIDLSRQEKMYRQNYCGCVFSRLERKHYVKIRP